jgi:glycopeptide antibiotics resistance protein
VFPSMTIELGQRTIDTWPAGVLVLGMLLFLLRRRGHSGRYLCCVAVFGVYALCALDRVLFPIAITGPFAEAARQAALDDHGYVSPLNLVPFVFGPDAQLHRVVTSSLLNILLTIPFGFGISFVVPVRSRQLWLLAPLVGVCLEAVQLLISLLVRYPYRVVDVNDVLFNALGVLIGYGLFLWSAQAYLLLTEQELYSRHSWMRHGSEAESSRAPSPSSDVQQ